MISITNLEKSFGDRVLFEGVSLQLNAGSRYGLVGANGSGKTTFMKVVAGDEPASDGAVTIPARLGVGVLRQDLFLDDEQKILDLVMMGSADAWRALSERAKIIDHGEGDPTRLADLEDVLAATDGYTLEARATSVLSGLGIPPASHALPLSTLSGGFKLRVLLAQVLLSGPDVLLLDEPTNHLDILSIRWLEKFLAAHRGTVVVISHDQRFLDNVVTHVLDVDYGTITQYTGNYSAFVVEKRGERERKESANERAEKAIAHKRAFVDRFGAKASKARQAQSRLKQIEKIHVEELADSSRRAPLFKFTPERQSGKDVLTVRGLYKSYGEKHVLRDVSLTVRRGEKVAVIGPNGLGKSTLLKIAMGRLAADGGSAELGHEVRAGYFAQDHHELLRNESMTPLEFVTDACPKETNAEIRRQLGRMLFSGRDVDKPVGALSGGEAARLIFCRIIAERPNLLALDEPTNHLDLESIAALIEGLKAFEGTLVFVSHDRFFVSELATRIVEITPSGLNDFPGTYAEYLERRGDDHLDADTVALKAKSTRGKEKPPAGDGTGRVSQPANGQPANGQPANAQPAKVQLSWEEQKRRRSRLNVLPARRDKLLASIEGAEARRKDIAALYAADGFFAKTPASVLASLEREDADLAAKIAAWIAEWESVEKEIAEMTAGLSVT